MASPFEGQNDERTETATPFRREEFRKQGTVALSREVVSVTILLSMGAIFSFFASQLFHQFDHLTSYWFKFGTPTDWTKAQLVTWIGSVGIDFTKSVWPVLVGVMVMGILASIAQIGWYVTWEPLNPNWDRLNPVSGVQRLMSGKSLVEGVKAVLKVVIMTLIVWFVVKRSLQEAGSLFGKSLGETLTLGAQALSRLFFTSLTALGVISALDYLYQRLSLEKQMKMTRREAKEEFKLREGDPLIKSRIRSIQRRLASKRMMDEVPKADVVVTNPTHFAVALKYDSNTMHAPRVVAKGAGFIAQKIREMAAFHKIPLVENKPLARRMYRDLEIGDFIPRELYKAVAEVLSFVYRLKARVA